MREDALLKNSVDLLLVMTIACAYIIKGIVHTKIKILSLITHPHVVPNP